jgi:hypothetical protein
MKARIVQPERTYIARQRLREHVPAATNRRGSPLLANGLPNTFPWQRIKHSYTWTVGDSDLYSVLLEVSSAQLSSFGSWFFVRHSSQWKRETRSPVRNGARLRQSLIWAVIIGCNCNRSANKSNQTIQNPLLFVTEPRTRDNISNAYQRFCVLVFIYADMNLLHR